MLELKSVMTILEIIIAVLAALALGDYLGYKFGHWRAAKTIGFVALAVIILFAVYAAVVLR